MINMRHKGHECNCRAVAVSDDGGAHFGATTFAADLVSPVCQASIARIHSVLYFANPASRWLRVHGQIKASRDDGVSWAALVTLTPNGLLGSFDYSSLVQDALALEPDSGGLLWSRNTLPLISALGPVPIGPWKMYFTRFKLAAPVTQL